MTASSEVRSGRYGGLLESIGGTPVVEIPRLSPKPAVRLFEKFRFRHSRTRKVGDKELMYFYLDLYMGEGRKAPHSQ